MGVQPLSEGTSEIVSLELRIPLIKTGVWWVACGVMLPNHPEHLHLGAVEIHVAAGVFAPL